MIYRVCTHCTHTHITYCMWTETIKASSNQKKNSQQLPTMQKIYSLRDLFFSQFSIVKMKRKQKQKPNGIETKYSPFHSMLIPKYYLYSVHDARFTAVAVTTLNSRTDTKRVQSSIALTITTTATGERIHNIYAIKCVPRTSSNITTEKPFRICLFFFFFSYGSHTLHLLVVIFVHFSTCIIYASYITAQRCCMDVSLPNV